MTNIATSIRQKTNTSAKIKPTNFSQEISSITTIPLIENYVRYLDYDGTVLYSYTKEEFLSLGTEPTYIDRYHKIRFAGWNVGLSLAQYYVENYGRLDIGAICGPDDNAAVSMDIKITDPSRTTVTLYYTQERDLGVAIDWGDGPNLSGANGTEVSVTHTYEHTGEYTIRMETAASSTILLGHETNNFGLFGDSTSNYTNDKWYQFSFLQEIRFNSDVALSTYAFAECSELKNVIFFNNQGYIPTYAFYNCYSLQNINLPPDIYKIRNYAFYSCNSLRSVTLSPDVTNFDPYSFCGCKSLQNISFPFRCNIGNYAFNSCSLQNVTLHDAVISTYAFAGCTSVKSFIDNTSSGSITMPTYALSSNVSLNTVVLSPKTKVLSSNCFSTCKKLKAISIPSGVTSITANCFYQCYALNLIDFSNHTAVPTLGATSAFNQTPNAMQIKVPSSLYTNWYRATNWASYSSRLRSLDVDLNNQWCGPEDMVHSGCPNPNDEQFYGVYESFSNTFDESEDISIAKMYIKIAGYTNFKFYIRSYAESMYDYVMVSQLDGDLNASDGIEEGGDIYASTYGNTNSDVTLDGYTLVEFTNIPSGVHTITVGYRKDSSDSSGTDKGYVLIPKYQ